MTDALISRIDRIMSRSNNLTDVQLKASLNHVRLDAMRQWRYYTPEYDRIDKYIRQALKARQRGVESVTDGFATDYGL